MRYNDDDIMVDARYYSYKYGTNDSLILKALWIQYPNTIVIR
jgi:hypothetical protein